MKQQQKQNKNAQQQKTKQQEEQLFEKQPKPEKGSFNGKTKTKTHEHNHPRLRRNQVFYYAMLIALAILAFLFLPESFIKENQGEIVAIITSVGLDREKESKDYLLTCQVISPDTTGQNQQKVALVNEKGETLTDALTNLSQKLGKRVGLDHCSVVAIGESLNGDEILPILDHFYREGNISLNSVLVNVKGAAVDLIKQSSELNNLSSGSIQNNFNFNKDFFGSSKISTLGTFFNEYFKKGSSCIIAEINMNYNQTKVEPAESPNSGKTGCDAKGGTSESGGGGQSGNSKSSGGGQSNGGGDAGSGCEELQDVSMIQNAGESIVYKQAKAVARASEDVNNGFNYLDNRVKHGIIKVDNVSDKNLDDATVSFTSENSTVKLKPVVDLENNKFIIQAKIRIWGEVSEVTENHQTKKISKGYNDLLSDELKDKLKEEVASKVDLALQFCKINNVDALNIEEIFYKLKNSEYEKLKKKLSINDNFLEYVEINPFVEVNHQN